MFKVLSLSDIHIDVNAHILSKESGSYISTNALENELIDALKKKANEYDLILFVGDLYNNLSKSLDLCESVEQATQKVVKFIPGNHDFVNSRITSLANHSFLEERYKKSNFCILEPYSLTKESVLLGNIGWYDYSFSSSSDLEELATLNKTSWFDGRYINYGNETDLSLATRYQKELEIKLEQLQNKSVFLASHFIPRMKYVTVKQDDDTWNTFNAFMGSSKFGEIVDNYPNVQYLTFGHTHNRLGVREHNESTKDICNPLGYVGEWSTIPSFARYLEEDNDYYTEQDILSIYQKELETVMTIVSMP